MGASVLLRAFAAGELDPGLSTRGDLDIYSSGLRTCRNFVVRRSGGVVSRPGLEHVAPCRDAYLTLLQAYIFPAADQCYVVEMGDHYFRFHHRLRGMVQELATPYTIGEINGTSRLGWMQSGAVVVLTHSNHPPMDLTMPLLDAFTLVPSVIGPTLAPPTDLVVTVGPAAGGTFMYQVTAVQAVTYEESLPSEPVILPGAGEGTPVLPHRLAWTPVADAIEYRVYRADWDTKTFGYLGTATGVATFSDIGQFVDYAFTPPVQRLPWDPADPFTNPLTAVIHQQRRIYGGNSYHRDQLYASRIGLPGNFTHRSPMQDDDGIAWRNVSRDLSVIQHMLSLGRQLVVLMDRGEWIVHGDSDSGLTPTTIYPDQVGYVGSSLTPPVIYGDRVLFLEARDVSVREWVLDARAEGLSGRDLTRNAAHLFRGTSIVAMAFALIPDAVLWCVRSDGVLLGLTYIPDENVLAWHRHDTEGGLFENIVVVPEPLEDAVYVTVNRGGTRSLERLGIRDDPTRAPALDRVVRARGTGMTTVSGLTHLAGQPVRVVADGERFASVVSALGVLDLVTPRDVVDVGVPITADLETLDLDLSSSDVRNRRKKITALAFQIENSVQHFYAGPDADHLQQVRPAPWQDPSARLTGRVELSPTGTYNDDGRVFIRHTEPTTLTVLGVFPTVDIGG